MASLTSSVRVASTAAKPAATRSETGSSPNSSRVRADINRRSATLEATALERLHEIDRVGPAAPLVVEHPPAAVGRDRARGDAAGVILLVQLEPKRQVVGHALIDRDEARVVRAEEEDLPARDVEADHDSAEEHERERAL